ncbi:MAG: riboflavin synthase [Thermomicrobium sp.]|nr:riboflavin synthase [Thermomicrobium sp.]MDW8059623.1 riboflavin synthase [Thermomicrobium sp.]
MFTGIIEEIGEVRAVQPIGGGGARLRIGCRVVLEGTKIGDSIAVDGVCLTVTDLARDSFLVELQPVTLRRSALGTRRVGDPVNLERAVAVGGRFGGHYVQGHVDGIGRVTASYRDGPALVVRIAAPPELMRYVVERGFIAVDGASLTIQRRTASEFEVSLVAYTQEHITLPRKEVGAPVNLEVDIVAKYVEQFVRLGTASGLTGELLERAGFGSEFGGRS